ncbi:MAG: hypothetical protein GY857_14320 [Desulfobacula sp.]|nr:hypothetical protein [Desulfobacula sp.]
MELYYSAEIIQRVIYLQFLTETMQNLIDKIKGFQGIKIEIVGSWLWVSGETKAVKEQLKKFGFKFSFNKKAWYYHENATYRKRSKKNFSMNDIRNMHGSQDIETESKTTTKAIKAA